jgi:hypothetical protein
MITALPSMAASAVLPSALWRGTSTKGGGVGGGDSAADVGGSLAGTGTGTGTGNYSSSGSATASGVPLPLPIDPRAPPHNAPPGLELTASTTQARPEAEARGPFVPGLIAGNYTSPLEEVRMMIMLLVIRVEAVDIGAACCSTCRLRCVASSAGSVPCEKGHPAVTRDSSCGWPRYSGYHRHIHHLAPGRAQENAILKNAVDRECEESAMLRGLIKDGAVRVRNIKESFLQFISDNFCRFMRWSTRLQHR